MWEVLVTKQNDLIEVVDSDVEADNEIGFYNFEISSERRQIAFSVNNILLNIIIPQFEYSFDGNTWYTQKHTEIWYTELPWKIWVRTPGNQVSFEMENRAFSEEELKESFEKKKGEDIIACDMTRFRSWINRDLLRNKLYVTILEKTVSFLDIIAKSYVIQALPEADFKRRQIIVKADIIGKAEYYIDLSYEHELIAEKQLFQAGKAVINTPIRSGKYTIEVFEKEDDEFGFDEFVFNSIAKVETKIVNTKDLTGKSIELLAITKDEQAIFKMQFNHTYIIKDLVSVDREGYSYTGSLVERQKGKSSIKVLLDIMDLDSLRYALVRWIDKDYGDEMEFLYDHYEKTLVREEKEGLRSAERYRRYECIFTDDYLYEIRILT